MLRVLIIEDEVLVALMLEELLCEMGHEVCGSGRTERDAISAAARCRPDLIISDARLSEGSGIEAVRAILEDGFVPHIFISGSVLDPTLLHPAAGRLQKPFDERQLAAAIARAVAPETVRIGEDHRSHCEAP
jgi:CheY-like chemotaxis protein